MQARDEFKALRTSEKLIITKKNKNSTQYKHVAFKPHIIQVHPAAFRIKQVAVEHMHPTSNKNILPSPTRN